MSLKTSMVGLALRLAVAAERAVKGRQLAVVPEAVGSVLILEYMLPLGCCVHLTPVFEAIRLGRPDISITVATRGLGAVLLRHHPFIDNLIETPDPLTDLRGTVRALSLGLAERGIVPDCVLTGASDKRTRIALVGVLAGKGWRGGFTLAPELYERPLNARDDLSLIDNNLRVAGLLGCETGHREPRVFFSPGDVARAEAMVREVNPEGRPLVVMVTQNSGGQRTGWHAERFACVIRHASEVLGCAVAYVGTKADSDAVKELRVSAGNVGVSLTGRTSVTELAALLAMSDYAISLDTGTMHVGRAAGVPMVVLAPSWQRPLEWLPLKIPQVRILRGMDREGVPEGYRLDEISTDGVCGALGELGEIYPVSAVDRAGRVARSVSDVDHLAR